MPARHTAIRLVAGIAFWAVPATAFCQDARVRGWLTGLASQTFRDREDAQKQLAEWARTEPGPAMDLFFTSYESATAEPEVRLRLREVLREVVVEDHQKNRGEGYVGVRMLELNLEVPGDKLPRTGIQITDVVPGGPGAAAGLEVGDVIVSLEGLRWSGKGATDAFTGAVRKFKPRERIKLEILRSGKVETISVALGARPLGMPDRPIFRADINGRLLLYDDPAEAEGKAKDRIFKNWLEAKRAGKKALP